MRRVQDQALRLFADRGYGAVTVEEIAAAAGVGPATVYRNFGSKEGMVLWDPYDPLLFDELAARLPGTPLVAALQDALVSALDRVYAEDAARILRRSRLLFAEPALQAAAAASQAELRRGLSTLLTATGAVAEDLEADVLAGAFVAVLAVAVEYWVRADGNVPLQQFLRQALRCLTHLGPS